MVEFGSVSSAVVSQAFKPAFMEGYEALLNLSVIKYKIVEFKDC